MWPDKSVFPAAEIAKTLFASLCLVSAVCAADQSSAPVSRIIDAEIEAELASQGITPAPRATDTELVRRLSLDLLGRIPTAAETTAFLEDERPDKDLRLIDALLLHPEMAAWWRDVFDNWANGGVLERDFGRDGFLDYLQAALQQNKPWDVMAREMIAPDLQREEQRGAAYFLATRLRGGDNAAKLDSLTSGVATLFFGVQLQCAKCHDHPFVEQWRQEYYYGLAAFLGRTQEARLENTPIIKERADGEVTFTTTGHEERTAKLVFLDGHVFNEPAAPEDRNAWYVKGNGGLPDVPYFSRRAVLAEYAFTSESEFFKRAIVNRLWKHLMGRGLVEPVDQMHAANPASHPRLLDRLADDFAQNRFDLRRLIAGILQSQAYRRSTRWTSDVERPADSLYATAILRPLAPDQLAVSVGVATGHFEQFRAKYEREKQSRKVDTITPTIARNFYARERDVQTFADRFRDSGETFEANAGQALFLTYNPLVQKQLEPRGGTFVDALSQQTDDSELVRTLFVTVLSRSPSDDELAQAAEYLSGDNSSRGTRCGELIWALLCSAEFRFNH